ncbi:hypothetical protein Aduo_009509 [Ancylostoma duodenale]
MFRPVAGAVFVQGNFDRQESHHVCSRRASPIHLDRTWSPAKRSSDARAFESAKKAWRTISCISSLSKCQQRAASARCSKNKRRRFGLPSQTSCARAARGVISRLISDAVGNAAGGVMVAALETLQRDAVRRPQTARRALRRRGSGSDGGQTKSPRKQPPDTQLTAAAAAPDK